MHGEFMSNLNTSRLIKIYERIKKGKKNSVWIQKDFKDIFMGNGCHSKKYLVTLEKMGFLERTTKFYLFGKYLQGQREILAWKLK